MLAEDKETGSLWYSPHGMAVSGPYKGKYLPCIPSYHMTFAEWLELHPDTDVMAPPDDPIRRDIRYGHGTFEALGRPGIARPMVSNTLTFPVDYRLPENTIIMGVSCGSQSKVYPLQEVRKQGSVVHDELDGEPIIVVAGPYPDSAAMAAYSSRVGDQDLEFSYNADAGQYLDKQTGSSWNIEGKAVAGEMLGTELEPVDACYVRWHGWAFSHKHTHIYLSDTAADVDPICFKDIVAGLEDTAYLIQLESRIMHLRLPNEATTGITLSVNGDRMNLYQFTSAVAAEDYAYAKAHSLRSGRYVMESDPDDRLKFADKLFTSRRKDEQIPWSSMLNPKNPAGQQFIADFHRITGEHTDEPGELKRVQEELINRDIEISAMIDRADAIDRGVLAEAYRFQLPMHALSARPIQIGKDPFMLYKFDSETAAVDYAGKIPKIRQSGRFVLRSTPRDMYYSAGFGERPLDEVSWSALLDDPAFQDAFDAACKGI